MGSKLGTLIRSARTDAGFTQAQLAEQIDGVSASEIGRYERGESEPTTQVVKSIAKACGVTQKSLLDAMPKTTTSRTSSSSGKTSSSSSGKTSSSSSGKTSSSSSGKTSSSSSSGTSMKLSTTEKRLVELYRAANSETRQKALKVLKGESTTDMEDVITSIGSILGETLFKK